MLFLLLKILPEVVTAGKLNISVPGWAVAAIKAQHFIPFSSIDDDYKWLLLVLMCKV